MSTPLIVTQLLLKRAEIEAQIKSLEDRLGQARADLLHVAATVRLFEPTAIDRPATVHHGGLVIRSLLNGNDLQGDTRRPFMT